MDTCGLERVERFRINLNEKNFASQKNTLTSSLAVNEQDAAAGGLGTEIALLFAKIGLEEDIPAAWPDCAAPLFMTWSRFLFLALRSLSNRSGERQ